MADRFTSETFRARLESAGFRTGDLPCGFSVRLPLLSRVEVRLNGGELDLVPRIGRNRRSTAIWVTYIFLLVLPLVLLLVLSLANESAEHWQVDLPYFLFILWGNLMAMVGLLQGYVATEGAMIRITQLWSMGDEIPPKANPSPRQG